MLKSSRLNTFFNFMSQKQTLVTVAMWMLADSGQECSLGLVCLGFETVSRRFLTSLSCLVSCEFNVSSQSQTFKKLKPGCARKHTSCFKSL